MYQGSSEPEKEPPQNSAAAPEELYLSSSSPIYGRQGSSANLMDLLSIRGEVTLAKKTFLIAWVSSNLCDLCVHRCLNPGRRAGSGCGAAPRAAGDPCRQAAGAEGHLTAGREESAKARSARNKRHPHTFLQSSGSARQPISEGSQLLARTSPDHGQNLYRSSRGPGFTCT